MKLKPEKKFRPGRDSNPRPYWYYSYTFCFADVWIVQLIEHKKAGADLGGGGGGGGGGWVGEGWTDHPPLEEAANDKI